MDDLIVWLRAQLSADAQAAQSCAEVYPAPWDVSDHGDTAEVKADEPHFRRVAELEQDPAIDGWLGERLEHIARWDPARVLALTTALRAIIDSFSWEAQETRAILILAEALYADQPGYREEWRP